MKSRWFIVWGTLLVVCCVVFIGCITTSFRPYNRRMHPHPVSDPSDVENDMSQSTYEYIERTLDHDLGEYEILERHYSGAQNTGFFFLSTILYSRRISVPLLLMSRHDTVSIAKIARDRGDEDYVVYFYSVSSGGTPAPLDGIFILTSNGRYSEPSVSDAYYCPTISSFVLPHSFVPQIRQADEIGISFYDPNDSGNVVWLDWKQREVLKDFLDYTDELTYDSLSRTD